MSPHDHPTKDSPNANPQNSDENSSKDEDSNDTSKPQELEFTQVAQRNTHLAVSPAKSGITHSPSKAKPISVIEEVRQSLRKKADKAGEGLESVFEQKSIDQAKESVLNSKCEAIKKAATNYLRKTGNSCKIDQADLVIEILRRENIKIPTNSHKKSGKQTDGSKGTKGSENGVKEGGGRAG